MAANIAWFLTGLLCGAGGISALMYRDWQHLKQRAREFETRLTELERTRQP